MSKKIVIITGANTGIGFETALALAEKEYKVILACRSLEKASNAKNSILEKFPLSSIEILPLDLSSPTSIKNFVNLYKEKYSTLNILINNAGFYGFTGEKNIEGHDLVMYTNYFGHFLLTSLLLNMFPNDNTSRIISLSSVVHKKASIYFDDINCNNPKHTKRAYRQSKLACLMFGDELDRRLKASNKKILSVMAHPGGSNTNIFNGLILPNGKQSLKYQLIKHLDKFIAHSNKEAAKPIVYAAINDSLVGGEYFGPIGFLELKGKVGEAKRSKSSKDKEKLLKLWEISLNITKAHFPYNI